MLLATLAAWPALARADASTTEYADPKYRFPFRFPADWQTERAPTLGEGGEVRLAAKSAAGSILVLAIVSPVGAAITREEFERRPDRDALVDELIQRTLGQVYSKICAITRPAAWWSMRRIGEPPTGGIGFSIHTTHTTPEGATTVEGMHVFPFGEPYVITLLVVARRATAAPAEVETRRRLLDSLRVNAPMASPSPAPRATDTAEIGRTGVRVSRLGLGGVALSGAPPATDPQRATPEDEGVALIRRSLALGLTYLDTAPMYGVGQSEARYGRALRGVPRDRFVLSTKVGRVLRPGAPASNRPGPSTSARPGCAPRSSPRWSAWGSSAWTSSSFTIRTTTTPRPWRRRSPC